MKIYWFANPYSPHVRHWLEASSFIENLEIEIIHIHHKNKPCIYESKAKLICLIPTCLKWLPSIIQYIITGIFFRFKFFNKKHIFIHAHNTSGYGLSALLSNHQYGVTTYGSEIYTSEDRSKVYRILIKSILTKAVFITSASPLMTNKLNELYGFSKKVREFSLGVSRRFMFSSLERNKWRETLKVSDDCTLLVINRRAAALYRTVEVVQCFLRTLNNNSFKLVLLSGDADTQYLKKLDVIVNGDASVSIINGFLKQEDVSGILSASDFFISTPKTDQLSSSILEGIVCDSVPILADLQAYNSIKEVSLLVDNQNFEMSLLKVFESLAKLTLNEREKQLHKLKKIKNEFDVAKRVSSYEEILDEIYSQGDIQ